MPPELNTEVVDEVTVAVDTVDNTDLSQKDEVKVDVTETKEDATVKVDSVDAKTETKAKEEAAFYSDLPKDWRSQAVKGMGLEGADAEKAVKRMERYKDLPAYLKSGLEAQKKIQEGLVKPGLPEDATPEQISEYRAANDIPESADKYDVKLEEGVILGEEDQRILDQILPIAHDLNVSNAGLSALVNAQQKANAVEVDRRAKQDGMNDQNCRSQLKDQWGAADFDTNVNIMDSFVAGMPESLQDQFKNARLADGTALLHSSEAINYFVDLERRVNPTAALVPNDAQAVQTMNTEIAALEKRMGDSDWHKDTAAQDRYMKLIGARDAQNKLTS